MRETSIFCHTRYVTVMLHYFSTDCVANSETQLVLIVSSVAAGVFLVLVVTFIICYIRHKKKRGRAKASEPVKSGRRNDGLELQET